MAIRILIIEDDRRLSELVARALREADMRADVRADGTSGLEAMCGTAYDVVVLDLMLPGIDGLEVCRRARAEGVASPVLVLTARDTVDDRVDGLSSGADDYLGKPFAVRELVARVRALGRRGPIERGTVLGVGDLRLDSMARRAWRGETEIDLSTTERSLLEVLMRHPGQVLDRHQLLELAWDGAAERSLNVVEVYIRNLREKVDRPFGRSSIETVRGTGYRLIPDDGHPG